MRKDLCAKMFKVFDVMDWIKGERKRVEGLIASKEFATNRRNWGWMIEWVKKTDEEHLADKMKEKDGYIETNVCCNICFTPQRHLLVTSFSFCDEYGCGMNICKNAELK